MDWFSYFSNFIVYFGYMKRVRFMTSYLCGLHMNYLYELFVVVKK